MCLKNGAPETRAPTRRTAGVVRAFIEHHLIFNSSILQAVLHRADFRADSSGGRYREFWQIGAEYFGMPPGQRMRSSSPRSNPLSTAGA